MPVLLIQFENSKIEPQFLSKTLVLTMFLSPVESLGGLVECYEDYFDFSRQKESESGAVLKTCKSVLHSKSKEESLVHLFYNNLMRFSHLIVAKDIRGISLSELKSQATFARWEPWHGNFGMFYPWNKYLQIGELLRELAAIIISLKLCLQSPSQVSFMTFRGSVLVTSSSFFGFAKHSCAGQRRAL